MPAASDALCDRLRQALFFGLAIGVQPRAIGTLQNQQIRLAKGRWKSTLHRALWRDTDIAGDHNRTVSRAKTQAQRTGNMSGTAGRDGYAGKFREGQALSNGQRAHPI